jgi:galactokinase
MIDDRRTGGSSKTARAAALKARLEALDNPPGAGPKLLGPAQLVRAPGRVNLIGEHTDYNEGLVLPAAIDREIWIALRPWDRPEVELTSVELNETRSFGLDGLAPGARGVRSWIDYVAGMAWAMREAGLPVRGFRGVMDSTIPIGSGLSSSAAFEMASSWALAATGAARPAAGAMAAIAQRGENRYVGVNCGIMDQFASAAGRAGHALLTAGATSSRSLPCLPILRSSFARPAQRAV